MGFAIGSAMHLSSSPENVAALLSPLPARISIGCYCSNARGGERIARTKELSALFLCSLVQCRNGCFVASMFQKRGSGEEEEGKRGLRKVSQINLGRS